MAHSAEIWVQSIETSDQWASFPCKDYIITNVCGVDKDYTDSGSLPLNITVGDIIEYIDNKGDVKKYKVKHIKFYTYDKDVDHTYDGKRITRNKGDTACTLYQVDSLSDTRMDKYPSRIVIEGCSLIR